MKNKLSGRPPKFTEECRPVTVTLPVRILKMLEKISDDRAMAIVKSVEAAMGEWGNQAKHVNLTPIGKNTSLLIIPYNKYLARIPWVRLVEITPSRFLLALTAGTPIESLEVAILDIIDNLPEDELTEQEDLAELRKYLAKYRRSEGVSKEEILLLAQQA